MPHVFANVDLCWRGDALFRSGRHRRPLLTIERDAVYPDLWRIHLPDSSLSDMVNRTRAKDAARSIALQFLNAEAQPPSGRQEHGGQSEPSKPIRRAPAHQ